jgi:Metal binding domain of Ada
MLQKLKSFLADDAIYYSILVILVAGASFGLGRQSVVEKNQENKAATQSGVVVTPSTSQVPTPTPHSSTTTPTQAIHQGAAVSGAVIGTVVASKSGSKYHLPTCAGAKQIKPDNLISFESIAAAEAAGYTPAANCKF